MSETNKAVIRSFVGAVNAHNWDNLRILLVPHFIRHSNAGGAPEVRSAEELITYLKNEYVTFPDAEETLLDLVAEGDSVAARSRFRGTQMGSIGSYPPIRQGAFGDLSCYLSPGKRAHCRSMGRMGQPVWVATTRPSQFDLKCSWRNSPSLRTGQLAADAVSRRFPRPGPDQSVRHHNRSPGYHFIANAVGQTVNMHMLR